MRDGGVALVYAATRKNAEAHAQALKKAGMRARVYHAGLEGEVRERAQDVFMAGQLDVIVATNAFGMGVDKSDIRLVVHADIPRSPEAYYQEAGRGGRDGKPTRCVLLFNHGDIRLQEFLIDASYPSPEILRGLWKLLHEQPALGALGVRGRGGEDEVEARLKAQLPGSPSNAAIGAAMRILEQPRPARARCRADRRRAPARRHVPAARRDLAPAPRGRSSAASCARWWITRTTRGAGASSSSSTSATRTGRNRDRRCGACDNCEAVAHGKTTGISEAEATAVRGLLGLVGTLHGRFGRTRIAALANGTDEDTRFAELPERGCVRGWSQKHVLDLLRALEGAGLVEASRGEYPTVATTRRGDQVAIGTVDVDELELQMPTVTKRVRKRR